MASIFSILEKSKKNSSLWREAYLYHIIKTFFHDWIKSEFENIEDIEVEFFELYIKKEMGIFLITLSSKINPLKMALRQHKKSLLNYLIAYCEGKNLFLDQSKVSIQIR